MWMVQGRNALLVPSPSRSHRNSFVVFRKVLHYLLLSLLIPLSVSYFNPTMIQITTSRKKSFYGFCFAVLSEPTEGVHIQVCQQICSTAANREEEPSMHGYAGVLHYVLLYFFVNIILPQILPWPTSKQVLWPTPAQVDTVTPLPTLIQSLPRTDDCTLAALDEVAHYLRKSKYLTIPEEWVAVFP